MTISITIIIVAVCVLVSYICFGNQELFQKLKHWPYAEVREKEWYRLISSGFIHGSWMHLLINMFVFWQFGEVVEARFRVEFGLLWGNLFYTLLFVVTVVLADIPSLLKHKDNVYYSAVGASGAVSGILFVNILFYPWNLLYLYAIIPIPGIIAGVLYLIYSSWASKNSRDNIDHDAHFYGALFGLLFTVMLKPTLFVDFINQLMHIPYFD
ncbi:MAG: rhomboid family intramembrane serine protease [Saprospiraceae bacterium]|nr:rhomboid family intramembrane serine protease [Saprospiraceae bacterium]